MNDSTRYPTPLASTRDALIQAGRRLFSQGGYDGTSVRAITREAGANLGAITYHFGSKEALYREVLDQVLGPLASLLEQTARGPGTALERVDRVIRTYVRFLARNGDVPKLLLQEIAAGKGPPAPVMELIRRVSSLLSGMLREGQMRGEIRPSDPLFLTLSMVAQPVFFALVRPTIGRLRGGDPMADGPALQAMEDHVAAVAVAALAASPGADTHGTAPGADTRDGGAPDPGPDAPDTPATPSP